MTEADQKTSTQRDAATLRILGWFFVVLGSLVLLGTFWTLHNQRAMVVNLGSGFLLSFVGGATVIASRRLRGKDDAKV